MTMNRKKEREEVITNIWSKGSTPDDLEFIDKGDHLKIATSCDDGEKMTAWWMGTLRALYPQDQCSGTGSNLKMRPYPGVTLQINKGDGTLRIKGKRHWEWFKENFQQVLETGGQELAHTAELNKTIDHELHLNDGHTVRTQRLKLITSAENNHPSSKKSVV